MKATLNGEDVNLDGVTSLNPGDLLEVDYANIGPADRHAEDINYLPIGRYSYHHDNVNRKIVIQRHE
jgi:hypothetical protein